MQRIAYDGQLWRVVEQDDFPHVAPFLADENFSPSPVHFPSFCFSEAARTNILLMQEIKCTIHRLDRFILRNGLHKHACLISQAGSQATMRLASKSVLRADWHTSVEIPFCLHVSQTGYCPRLFDYEELHKQAQWLIIFEEVLLPLDKMESKKLSIIAPHQSNKIVKNAIMKSKRERTKKYSRTISGEDSTSSGYGSI